MDKVCKSESSKAEGYFSSPKWMLLSASASFREPWKTIENLYPKWAGTNSRGNVVVRRLTIVQVTLFTFFSRNSWPPAKPLLVFLCRCELVETCYLGCLLPIRAHHCYVELHNRCATPQ